MGVSIAFGMATKVASRRAATVASMSRVGVGVVLGIWVIVGRIVSVGVGIATKVARRAATVASISGVDVGVAVGIAAATAD